MVAADGHHALAGPQRRMLRCHAWCPSPTRPTCPRSCQPHDPGGPPGGASGTSRRHSRAGGSVVLARRSLSLRRSSHKSPAAEARRHAAGRCGAALVRSSAPRAGDTGLRASNCNKDMTRVHYGAAQVAVDSRAAGRHVAIRDRRAGIAEPGGQCAVVERTPARSSRAARYAAIRCCFGKAFRFLARAAD